MSHLDFLSRRAARREAEELGLPWPGGTGDGARTLLEDALITEGLVRFDPPLGGTEGEWRVTCVLDCEPDHCIAVIDVESGDWVSGASISGRHLPLTTRVRPA